MNYYLCPIDNKIITGKNFYPLNELLTIDYPVNVLLPFKLNERVLLAQHNEDILLPYEFSIDAINRTAHTLTLRVSAIYQNILPLATLSLLLPAHMLSNYVQLTEQQAKGITSLMNVMSLKRSIDDTLSIPVQPPTQPEVVEKKDPPALPSARLELDALNTTLTEIGSQFATIAQHMQTFLDVKVSDFLSEPEEDDLEEDEVAIVSVADDDIDDDDAIFSEGEVLDYVKDYIRRSGCYFEDETLYNYHISLKTRPFVILAGLSGTGKSKLAQLYADALGQDKTFKRLAVRPNWNDDRYLLGHLNTVTGEYVTEPAVEFIMAALADQKKLYSLCLDEMNLAHVEYYFSQFLSAMEGDRLKDRSITLMSERSFKQLHAQHRSTRSKATLPSAEISLPYNLIFTGTINVDETTQPISDKVIDRANTIEFFNVDLNFIPEPSDPGEALPISNRAWQSYRATTPDTGHRAQIIEINKILKQADMGLGYRVVHEIELYLANSHGLLTSDVAFDLQCKQRILPRIRGTETIDGMLGELITFSKKNRLAQTEKRLQEMKSRLKRDGYTSFWR
ncbi:McrB family protein [Dictyobacter arantiisoli]|uniref:ATPase dynein-related AAA domain-containing protein n=1 Tax=Dictyobacter arantiisoli TaxID=2014874 RepID=A0A5A5TI57_9CHLR|nr:AAA family ATPase [Dictyobacter arantiisoli]GCF11077.1 hypothetical protein KDI_46410 [Dictyobacter arantiisoli]